MKENDKQTDAAPEGNVSEKPDPAAHARDRDAEVAALTDKWKRALADAENARKRADAARIDGREHGIAVAVEALAPAFDAIFMAIEAARNLPEAQNPSIAAHLQGLTTIKSAFQSGLTALGVRLIEPKEKEAPFDPELHEAAQIKQTNETKPGNVFVLHRPGFAIGRRLIRPAHVTISAAPDDPEKE